MARVKIPGPPSNRSIVLSRGWLAMSPLPLKLGSPAWLNFVSTLPLFTEGAEWSKDEMCDAIGGPLDAAVGNKAFQCTRLRHADGPHLATVNDPGGRVEYGRVLAVWVDPS